MKSLSPDFVKLPIEKIMGYSRRAIVLNNASVGIFVSSYLIHRDSSFIFCQTFVSGVECGQADPNVGGLKYAWH